MIAHSYGILPGQETVLSVLTDYLLVPNPEVVKARNGEQDSFNVLYQNRAVGVNPSPVFIKYAERMTKLSSLVKVGVFC